MARGRTRIVCNFCRKRKIACDKGTPCLMCLKYGNSDCVYEFSKKDTGSAAELRALRQRLDRLEKSLVLPRSAEMSLNEITKAEMNFNEITKATRYRDIRAFKQLGPFRWVVVITLDFGLYSLFKNLSIYRERNCATAAYDAKLTLHPANGDVSVVSHRGNEALFPEIEAAMPRADMVHMYVDRYFKVVHPWMPVLDETQFKSTVSELLSQGLAGRHAHAGQLLLVLRFSFLSLFRCTGELVGQCWVNSAEEVRLLSQWAGSETWVEHAHRCLGAYDLVADNQTEVIQLAAMLRLYSMFCPERNTPDTRNRLFSGVLYLMAYGRWLHREPTLVFASDSVDAGTVAVLRRLWYVLVFVDTVLLALTGNLPALPRALYDVRLPEFEQRLECEDRRVAEAVGRFFARFHAVQQAVADVLALLGAVAGTVPVERVEAALARAEATRLELWAELGPGNLASDDSGAFARGLLYYLFFVVHHVVVGVYQHLYHHYGPLAEGRVYQRRMTLLAALVLECLPALLGDSAFGGTTDLFVFPIFTHCLQQASLYLWGAYVGYKAALRNAEAGRGSVPRNLAPAVAALALCVARFGSYLAFTEHRHGFSRKLLRLQAQMMDLAASDKVYTFSGCYYNLDFDTVEHVCQTLDAVREATAALGRRAPQHAPEPEPFLGFYSLEDMLLQEVWPEF